MATKVGIMMVVPSYLLRRWVLRWLYRGVVSIIGNMIVYRDGIRFYRVYPVDLVWTYKGNFVQYLSALKDEYPEDGLKDNYYYDLEKIAPKYTLYRYDEDYHHNLTLKCIYDPDTMAITTVPIDISNKGKNKLKLTLTASDSDYRTYISSDNTNWQEVTDITSGEPKELNVEGWNNLYIKIEINTSTINSIDVAYYKD